MKTQIKKVLAISALITTSILANAQIGFTGGLVGGVSIGSVKTTNLPEGFADAIEGNNIYGFEAGVYAKPQLGPFYARPQLLYNFQNGNVTYHTSDNNSHTSNFSLHKLEVPLLFGIRILILNIEAGPVYNYVLQVTERYNDNTVDIGRNGMGYRVGAGIALDRLSLNVSYQGATYNTGSGRATFKEPYKVIFGIGVRL